VQVRHANLYSSVVSTVSRDPFPPRVARRRPPSRVVGAPGSRAAWRRRSSGRC
jgi:hypothetical protein